MDRNYVSTVLTYDILKKPLKRNKGEIKIFSGEWKLKKNDTGW